MIPYSIDNLSIISAINENAPYVFCPYRNNTHLRRCSHLQIHLMSGRGHCTYHRHHYQMKVLTIANMMMKVQLCLLSKRRNTNSFPDTDKIDFEYCNLYIVYCIKEEWK